MVAAMNLLYECTAEHVGAPPETQEQSERRILATCVSNRRDLPHARPEEAARKLPGSRFDYNCGESCTVEDYDPEKLSLPPLNGTPVWHSRSLG